MVFQHFMLADNFTVWENIVLGDEPGTKVGLKPGRRVLACGNSAQNTGSASIPMRSCPVSGSATSSASRS